MSEDTKVEKAKRGAKARKAVAVVKTRSTTAKWGFLYLTKGQDESTDTWSYLDRAFPSRVSALKFAQEQENVEAVRIFKIFKDFTRPKHYPLVAVGSKKKAA